MNIFYLSHDPKECVEFHNSKHCVKMILEQNQILCTAHRVLDGVEEVIISNNRKKRVWQLNNSYDSILYSATHVNHPSTIWARENYENYMWLYNMTKELCKEYTYRYGKVHKCERSGLMDKLQYAPMNIKPGVFTEPTPAMPDYCKVKNDSIASYRNYYIKEKQHIANWSGKIAKRNPPPWFEFKIA